MAVQNLNTSQKSKESNQEQAQTSGTIQPPNRDHQESNTTTNDSIRLKRSLDVWNGIAIIIGVIVGSGIFISPKGVLQDAGSVGASLVVWALCGLMSLLGALCFAELGTSISTSGGEFTYINMSYGPLASYLYIWVLVLIIMPCSNAVAALTFANYCLQPLYEPGYTPPEEAIRLMALAILMLLIFINCVSLNGTMKLQSSFTLAKVMALGLIILYGTYYILSGNQFESLHDKSSRPRNTTAPVVVSFNVDAHSDDGWWSGTQSSLPHLARAFYSGFFTYSGWTSLNAVTEEIKDPQKNMPRAIVMSIAGVTLIYTMANAAYFALLSKEEILSSDAIAVLFGDKAFPSLKWLMPLVVAMSTVGGLNGSIFAAARVYFAAAREGQLFNALAMINTSELTPVPSLLFLGLTSIIYLMTTEITNLIIYMTFIEATFAALGVSTMLALRWQKPELYRPLRVPLLIPIVYLVFAAVLIVLPLWSSPWEAAIGVFITLTGLPAYYLTAKWQHKPKIYQRLMDKSNATIQKLTLSVMPSRDLDLH